MKIIVTTEPFDFSSKPAFGTAGYSGRRGRRVVLLNFLPESVRRVIIFEGDEQQALSLAAQLDYFFKEPSLCPVTVTS